MTVRLELGQFPSDTQLIVDSRNILAKMPVSKLQLKATVEANEVTILSLDIHLEKISADIDPVLVIQALRDEADALEQKVKNG